jgi:hypothetical protein
MSAIITNYDDPALLGAIKQQQSSVVASRLACCIKSVSQGVVVWSVLVGLHLRALNEDRKQGRNFIPPQPNGT